MKHSVIAPSVGESITEVSILKWAKKDGEAVKAGELLFELESDKATVEIQAEQSGVLKILKAAGDRLPVGATVAEIDDAGKPTVLASAALAAKPATPAPSAGPSPAATVTAAATGPYSTPAAAFAPGTGPAARKAAAEGRAAPANSAAPAVSPAHSTASYGGATGPAAPAANAPKAPSSASLPDRPGDRRVPMSNLRARIAERLVQAQHTAAILTTFNEVDMGPVMDLRNREKEAFKAKHGVALSFMSFFTRAAVEVLKQIPEVNASVDGRDVVYHDYQDVGIAVGSERGLVVPVVRDAGKLGFVEIEKKIGELAVKAREGKLSIADMSGGTFTISNGGTYGSLMSTPILNPPQSAILGMHKIQERPMAVEGKVVIRPMMYLALSYDHRLIDGKGAVTFLVALKDFLEHPEKLQFTY